MAKTVRLSLNVDEEVWRALRHDAVDRDVSERELVERLIAKKYSKAAGNSRSADEHQDHESQGY